MGRVCNLSNEHWRSGVFEGETHADDRAGRSEHGQTGGEGLEEDAEDDDNLQETEGVSILPDCSRMGWS